MKLLSRARQSRGFGVHSPFAFRFITQTLKRHSDAMYYAEELMPHDRMFRLMVRVVAALQPKTALLVGCDNQPLFRNGIAEADSCIRFIDKDAAQTKNADMVIVAIDEATDANESVDLISGSNICALIVYDRDNRQHRKLAYEIADRCEAMTFENGRDMIIKVKRSDLPHQTFNVNF